MYEVSEILFTALEGLIFIVAFVSLSDCRDYILKHYRKVIFFVVFYTIYTYLMSIIFPKGLQTIPIAILTIIILNFMFNSSLVKTLIKYFLYLMAMSLVELFLVVFGVIVLKLPAIFIINNDNAVFICSIIAKLVEAIAALVLYKSNLSINFFIDKESSNSRFRQILILISSVLFLLVCLNIYITSNPDKLLAFNTFSFIVYAVLIIAVVFVFREVSRLELLEFASELEKENIKQLIEFNEMVAKERHEYKNHLNTIYGLCTLNKPDLNEKIKLYINSYANNNDTRNIAIDSGNDYVDAIINVKYNNAIRKGINLIVDFDAPLSSAKIAEDVAVTIISNIIENAFESIVTIDKEKKYISIQTYIDKNNYFISISNNGPMISESDKKKIFNAGFSTKDNSTKKRGFGLSIVLAEIERFGGSITINSNDEVTEFLVSLKVNSQQSISQVAL
ncbi:histidine kinase/DNA gyrase B/HSP90-like ATPase [Ruminiclostridium sufflavum DSM 19573]|uniref:Histidine kinase/DNA gyrase B/HSP90-like ATPase n=1 Tax=Ruminiclostridium sufflavum DSM 19573 TaxID=1121337 RepID=A0A318Y1Z9_9FIRM|nr:ATP-binding protein [Ruminiclostridium sufflavum]PYG85008.1 histidine kinase/DNA gyrase B/HSP90-like ATPase [Ruminiclostridium sufflavum DSM 19573]